MTSPQDPPPRRPADPSGATPAVPSNTTPGGPSVLTAPAPTVPTGHGDHTPTAKRLLRERRAHKRERVRIDAAAIRRGMAEVGMWGIRAPKWMWIVLLIITAIGGALRLYRLGFPHSLIFDETYYVKDSYSMINFGYERAWPEGADTFFNAGDPSIIENTPEYVVHPPLGKWVIGLGIDLFGADDSFGWRFSVAVVGTLTIFLTGYIAWKLLRSPFFACVAAVLIAVDGEHFVHSRTSLLDIVLMAFVLLGFAFLILDREQITKRLVKWAKAPPLAEVSAASSSSLAEAPATSPRSRTKADARLRRRRADELSYGPRLGVRWWLIAAGISLGLAMGVKWSGLYALAAFGIMVVAWDVHSRYRAGAAHPWLGMFIRDSIPAFLTLVPIAFIAYVTTWTGWILSTDGWDRQWAAQTPGWWQSLPDWLQWLPSLAHYHYTAYSFHVGLDAEHPYMSNPWGWIVQWRPTSFYYESINQGSFGCDVTKCSSAITSVGNPVVWTLAPLAILVLLGAWILRRDARAGVILAGFAATWLPWFAYQQRTIFTFYTIVMVPFVVLALTYALALLWGRRPPGHKRGTLVPWPLAIRRLVVGIIVAAAVLAFGYFWPIYTGEVIPFEDWNNRMWTVTWR